MVKAKRDLPVTRLLGVDGDEETNTVTYHYGVFDPADLEDQTVHEATPLREFSSRQFPREA